MTNSKIESVPWFRLGNYIERSMVNNSDLKYGEELIEGVNSNGEFCKTKADLLDINLKPYKLVNNGDFVYNPSRFNIGSIAYRTQGFCIVSHLYVVFRLNELGKQKIDPFYLYMYIYRKEFFRMITYLNFGSQRPEFNFFELGEIKIPLPSIETQRELVAVYNGLKELAEENEKLLEPLSKSCEAFIVDCKKKYPSKRLGDMTDENKEKNTELTYGVDFLKGVTSAGKFDKSKANTDGLDFSNYKIVSKNNFAYNPSRINVGSIALNSEEKCIVSPMYVVFKVTSKELVPEYLKLWFSRKEFQRSTLFYAVGSVRDTFDFNLMQNVQIPLPPIQIQQKIVDLYNCYEECKRIATQAREKIQNICPALVQKAANIN